MPKISRAALPSMILLTISCSALASQDAAPGFETALPGGFAFYLVRGTPSEVSVPIPGASWSILSKPVLRVSSAGRTRIDVGWTDLNVDIPGGGCLGLYIPPGSREAFCAEEIVVPDSDAAEFSTILMGVNLTESGRRVSLGVRSNLIRDFQIVSVEEGGSAEIDVNGTEYVGEWSQTLGGWIFSPPRRLMFLTMGGSLRNYTLLLQTILDSPVELNLSSRIPGVVALRLEPSDGGVNAWVARDERIPLGRDLVLGSGESKLLIWLPNDVDLPAEAEILSVREETSLSELVVRIPSNATVGSYEIRVDGREMPLVVRPGPSDGNLRVQIPARLSAGSEIRMTVTSLSPIGDVDGIFVSEILPYVVLLDLSGLPQGSFDISLNLPHSSNDLSSEVMFSLYSAGNLVTQDKKFVSVLGSIRVSLGGSEVYSLGDLPVEAEVLNLGARSFRVVNATIVLDGEPAENMSLNMTVEPMSSSRLELDFNAIPGEHELSILLGIEDQPWSVISSYGPTRFIKVEGNPVDVSLEGGTKLPVGIPADLTIKVVSKLPLEGLTLELNVTGAEFNVSLDNLSWRNVPPESGIPIPLSVMSREPGSAEIVVSGSFSTSQGYRGTLTRKFVVEFGGITGRAIASTNSSEVNPGGVLLLTISILGFSGNATVVLPEGFLPIANISTSGTLTFSSPGTVEVSLRVEARPGTYLLPLMIKVGDSAIPVDPARVSVLEYSPEKAGKLMTRLLSLRRTYSSMRELGRGEIYVVVGEENLTVDSALSLAADLINSGRYSEAAEILDAVEGELTEESVGLWDLEEPDLLLALTVIISSVMLIYASSRKERV